jgi:hypothetical protein
LRLPYHLKLLTGQDVHGHRLVGPEVASKCWSVSLWDSNGNGNYQSKVFTCSNETLCARHFIITA